MRTSSAIGEDESRSNALDVISLRAFEKWAARGRPANSSLLDWLEAESEMRQVEALARRVCELEQRFCEQAAANTRTQRRLEAEHDVARTLSIAATLEEAAPHILRSVCESLDYAVGVLWILDRQSAALRCEEVFQSPDVEGGDFMTSTRELALGPGEGLPGRVWASQTPISNPDAAADLSLPRRAAAAATDLHEAIAFPVRSGAEFLGVMEFYGRNVGEPDPAIAAMMASIGRQISQFIERRHAEAASRRELEERQVAGRIQQRLLPHGQPNYTGYDIGGRCVSAFNVGGDCFDFFSMTIDCDECLGILVGDASGHGVGAALLIAETRAYVRALAMTCPDVDRLLSLVNQRLADNPDREGFVTAMLLRLAPRNGAVVHANAGHCPAIVFDQQGNVRSKLNSTGFPLGIDPDTRFSAEYAKLGPGELLLLFSDGTIEACSPHGELFGIQRLCDIVSAHVNEPSQIVLDAVFSEINRFQEGAPLRDDITAVVIRRVDRM